jgi:hypothetical protein
MSKPNPTISEIHEARKLLDREITSLMNSFTEHTGIKIRELRIEATDSDFPWGPPRIYDVKTQIEF